MVENFKITAVNLKRIVKISINLPTDYNSNNNEYPVIFSLDGQLLNNYINEQTRKININKIQGESKCIIISIQSPKIEAWRMSELNPYYNGDDETVDIVLSYIYFDYIVNELIPLLKQKYRLSNDMYLMGFKESAIACLYMVYRYSIFKGAGLFDPTLSLCNNKLITDIEKNFTPDKKMYLFHGGLNTDSKIDDLFYKLYTKLESLKINDVYLDYNQESDNSFEAIEQRINGFLNYLL